MTGGRGGRTWPERMAAVEGPLVYLIALHSLIVGGMLLIVPEWAVTFAGWPGATPLFFPRQAGIFHFVVVLAYLGDWHSSRSVRMIVATKAIAFAFLMGAWLDGEAAWSVPFSGLADGAMGLAAALVHRAGGSARAVGSGAEVPTSS